MTSLEEVVASWLEFTPLVIRTMRITMKVRSSPETVTIIAMIFFSILFNGLVETGGIAVGRTVHSAV